MIVLWSLGKESTFEFHRAFRELIQRGGSVIGVCGGEGSLELRTTCLLCLSTRFENEELFGVFSGVGGYFVGRVNVINKFLIVILRNSDEAVLLCKFLEGIIYLIIANLPYIPRSLRIFRSISMAIYDLKGKIYM